MKRLLLLLIISCSYTENYAQLKEQMNLYIDSLFRLNQNHAAPGVAITVIKDGSILTRKDMGMANLEHQIPFNHNTPVRLGYSGTREFMCAGLALMETNGLLNSMTS